MSAIGKRVLNLFIGADVTFFDPATETTTTVYWSNRSWITNPNDPIAANRQYVGLLAQAYDMTFSWFKEDQIGGRSERNFGELRAINPDGAHSLAWIFEDELSVQGQPITFRIGEIGDDLDDMITFTIEGREVRPSDDGAEVVIDLADAGQALDTSIFIDRFQGLGACVRHAPGVTSSVPDDPALDPYSAWYFDIAYRLPSWAALSSGLEIASRGASGGGHVCRLELLSTGFLRVSSRTLAGATVALTTTDLEWVADGRWHRFVGKWNGAVLKAFHSTRTGGALSEDTAALATIQAGSGDLLWGDIGSTLGTHEYVDVALVALGKDTDVPTDAEILDRMKRPLTEAEVAACEAYYTLDERTGTHAFDQSKTNVAASGTLTVVTLANGDTVTVDGKVYTAENSLTNVDGHFKVGLTDRESILNLIAAFGLGSGSGTAYAAATTLHPIVFASDGSVAASGTLTVVTTADGDTVTIDGKTYTIQDTLTNVDGHVKRNASNSVTLDNLIAGIRLGVGAGTLYAAATTLHPTVSATAGAGDTMVATAKTAGTAGNAIATTDALTSGSWAAGTLTGGIDAMTVTAKTLGTLGNPITTTETLTDGSWTAATLAGGVGHTATVPNAWQPTFEGRSELAGQAKPLAWGRRFNVPIVWADREEREGVAHARCYKGAAKAYVGGNGLSIGWPKMLFRSVTFDAATKTISFATRSAGGAARLDAQPGFSGLVAGQELDLVFASNTLTVTLASDSTERSITVVETISDAASEDGFVTANGPGGIVPRISLWHDAGGVITASVPSDPVTLELLGDIGAEIPTDDGDTHFPEYAAAIMRCILRDWGGVAESDISDNWDNGIDAPDDPAGAYFAYAGVWLDPAQDREIRDVLDDGGSDTLWARWGPRITDGEWDLLVIGAPAAPADVELGALEILNLRREKSVPPTGGLTVRAAINDRPLEEGEVAGVAEPADAAALQRKHLEGKPTLDPEVLKAFPHAQALPAVDTWLRYHADAQAEAQRRYDVLKVRRELFESEAILCALDQDPFDTVLELTDAGFASLAAGKVFHQVELKAKDEEMTHRGWG